MNLPKEYSFNAESGKYYYKGYECVGHKTCEKHGRYPCVYKNDYGQMFEINDKKCPLCYRAEMIEKELGRACIPQRFMKKTFENFETKTTAQTETKKVIQDYAEHFEENLKHGRSMIFMGAVGTGKTHLAVSLLRTIIAEGYSGLFVSAGDLITDVRDTWRTTSEKTTKEVIKHYVDIDLLVIDEIGVQRGTENEREVLFTVINQRYNNVTPTVLLTNCTMDEVKEYIGKRLYDRLKEDGGQIIAFTGESYR